MDTKVVVLSGNGNVPLAKEIAEYLGLPLGRAFVGVFPDGEVRVQILEPVQGKIVVVVQSTPSANAVLELGLLVDAAKRGGAFQVIAVIPYFGYARQDKRIQGEPLSGPFVCRVYQTAGVDVVLTLDLHNPTLEGAFTIPFINLSPAPALVASWHAMLDLNMTIVAPDSGALNRANRFCDLLGTNQLAVVNKIRKDPRHCEYAGVSGCVEGRPAMIVDDIVSTGTTLVQAARLLKERGATKVYASVTHLASTQCLAQVEKSDITCLFVTDSLPARTGEGASERLQVVTVAPLLANALMDWLPSDPSGVVWPIPALVPSQAVRQTCVVS